MVRVATFNLEYGGDLYGIQQAEDALKELRADVILLQETHSHHTDRNMVRHLVGWNSIPFERSHTAILTHKKITKIAEGSHFGIAKIGKIYYCVIHLSDQPYLPMAASGMPYPQECVGDDENPCFYSIDPKELTRKSLQVRGPELRELALALSNLPKNTKIIAGGDFNEPSHLDWTPAAVRRREVPLAIEFPCTRIMEELNFIDTYRAVNDDRGYTWPDRKVEYEYRSDRIDFIFARNMQVRSSQVIKTGLSDHTIVLSEVE